MAAALYTAIGTMEFNDAAARPDGLRADPIRVIQAVALGIGFLGSGVRLRPLRPGRRGYPAGGPGAPCLPSDRAPGETALIDLRVGGGAAAR
jgi:hypothetical protein